MNRYHCPYCPPQYVFHKQTSNGGMICGQCGEPLLKKPFIRTTQIIAFLAAIAFTAPFIAMVLASLKNLNKPTNKRMIEPITIINKVDRDKVSWL